MEGLVKDLYDLVSDSLSEMIWRCNFPVNPNVGLWSFLEAFREFGAQVAFDGTNASFSLDRTLKERQVVLQSSMHKDEIICGWGWQPSGSPHAFYDSICEVYFRMGKLLKGSRAEENFWDNIKHSESKEVRVKFEEQLEVFFPKYQENMLVPVSGLVPKLDEPKLFNRVLKDFPMDVYQQAVIKSHEGVLCTPCAETLLEIDDWSEFDDKYHPSVAVMEDYFWGHYLFALMKEKGYKTEYDDDEPLRGLVENGYNVLKKGNFVFPCKGNPCSITK